MIACSILVILAVLRHLSRVGRTFSQGHEPRLLKASLLSQIGGHLCKFSLQSGIAKHGYCISKLNAVFNSACLALFEGRPPRIDLMLYHMRKGCDSFPTDFILCPILFV